MQSAGLVALSLLGGVLLVVIIGGMIVLGFFLWNARKVAQQHAADLKAQLEIQNRVTVEWTNKTEAMLGESKKQFDAVYAEMKAAAESFRSSSTGARQETRQALGGFITEAKELLDNHHIEMKTIVTSINGESLQTASTRAINACLSIEKLVAMLHGMLLTHNDREDSPSKLGPDEYAPEDAGTSFSQNPTAAGDTIYDREESEEALTN